MRSGGACTVQQTLTTEAASVLKHSLSLARRRGHAQVTPLHVAATLLMSSRATHLRRACLKSQPSSYQTAPLQCRALELCFNVALNRLPTTPGPLLHGQPSLSNALIAALKRAQAHQRRGCIENQQQQHQAQQQPLLAIKVELEQLILSILDDPSVSRVMREAGFSSTAVKNNLEDINLTSSLTSSPHVFFTGGSGGGVYSSPSSPNSHVDHQSHHQYGNFWQTHFLNYPCEQNPVFVSPQKGPTVSESGSLKEDMSLVMDVLLGKKKKSRNTIIVGDSVALTEGLVVDLMGKVERGDVPEELKSAHFIKFQFSSVPLRFMKREEVEMNLSDLKKKVESLSGGARGVIIYAGDLKWTVDDKEGEGGGGYYGSSTYSPVDHLVGEIGRLISEYSSKKIWVMGTANYQTYMKCKMKQPSLESQWALQAVSVPSGGLGLSLNATSVQESRINLSHSPSHLIERKPLTSKDETNMLTCCAECTSNYDKEAALFKSSATKNMDKTSTLLPYWLQSQPPETIQKDDLAELRRKWNRLCQSLHQGRNTQNNYTTSPLINYQGMIGKSYSYPLWPNQNNSISFADSTLKPNRVTSSFPRFRRQQSCHIEFSFSNGDSRNQAGEPNLDLLKSREGKEVKITLALGNSLSSDSGKVTVSKVEEEVISKCLLDNVPWQSETIPSIVEVLVDSKSNRKDTWLLIEGNDSIGKRRLGLAIAEAVFGSADLFLCLSVGKKEKKLSQSTELLERALRNHENIVVLVQDVDLGDSQFVKFLSDGFESGKFGENGQAIFILTKGDHHPRGFFDDDKPNSVVQMKLQVNEVNTPLVATPNSDHEKRRAEWDLSSKSKSKVPRISEKESGNVSMAIENGNVIKKDLSRQSSSNSLDLNIRADDNDGEVEEFSPNSSDLTREMGTNFQSPFGFLELIKPRFVFDRASSKESLMKEILLCKIKGAFKEVFGSENLGLLTVENVVLEEVLFGFGSYLDSLFEKWLKDVFQTSLQTVKIGGKEGMGFRLCLGGGDREMVKGNGIQEGFMVSNLPKEIKVCFMY